ncbi:MAG: serine/threonine protein kinase, partial [Rubrivivax sp.]|nr:serine/threonine protein kinase [Rubrivivax sp.]
PGREAVVAKFYRPGRWSNAQIVEEHSFALELAAAEVPVVPPRVLQAGASHPAPGLTLRGEPPTLACLPVGAAVHRYSVATRCAGREAELDDPATLQQLGRFIGRLHSVGQQRGFTHRVTMDPRIDGRRARDLVLDGGFVSDDQRPAWVAASQAALDLVEAAFERLAPLQLLRLHGDCHLGNVLWRDGAPHVVDLDDACMGPAVQDLWMLVSGDRPSMTRQLHLLLEGYEQFRDFDDRELALIEPLRTLRMLRHSAWLAARWSDPTFPLNFPYFGTSAYWSQQVTQLHEQAQAMALSSPAGG